MAEMKLGLFIRPCGHHIASWRHPNCHTDAGVNFKHFVAMAQTAERGLFDMLFSADTNSAITAVGPGLNRQHYVAWLEPFTLLSALVGYTRDIGLVCTQTTTFDHPYNIARRFAALDLISDGRAGWNVVTSGNDQAALNYNMSAHLPKAERYKIAREFVDVVKGLWDSWEDDAFVRDRKTSLFFDEDKMHALDHEGQYFRVKGPLNVARSPQGHPVVVQAGASDDGMDLAAATADVVFGASQSIEGAQAFYRALKGRLGRHGREPGDLKILPGLSVTVAPTLQEAKDKHEELQALIHPDVGLALLSRRIGHDLNGMDPDAPMPDLGANDEVGSRSGQMFALARRENMTLRQLYEHFAAARGHMMVVGTPAMVADAMQEWFQNDACDGFNVLPPMYPDDLDSFVDLVVPELQRRGLFRKRYEGKTLRDRLGLKVPQSRYAKAKAQAAE